MLMSSRKDAADSPQCLRCFVCPTTVGHVFDNCRTRVRQLSDKYLIAFVQIKHGDAFRQ
jgi:hypothetical protein